MKKLVFDPKQDGKAIVAARHREFIENELLWVQLLDAFEGGRRYQTASYGIDIRGLPIRNLIRHKHEFPADGRAEMEGFGNLSITVSPITNAMLGIAGMYPGAPGSDMSAFTSLGDYWLRLARTPVPTFFADAIESHLGKIYNREIRRDGPPDLMEWWEDVDGRGSTIDQWMSEAIAPLLFTIGHIDVVFDHPATEDQDEVRSQADVKRLRLDRCIAAYILPTNLPWWNVDKSGRYLECVVREWDDSIVQHESKEERKSGDPFRVEDAAYRYWNADGSWLFDSRGELVDSTPHGFGCVPIVRLFDKRNLRRQHVGKPRYEAIAQLSREYYNRNSELILSDTLQSHALLQAPEDYIQADDTVSIGPDFILPKKKVTGQSGQVSYEGFEYLEPPKGPAESLRINMAAIEDAIDRETKMTKPAGAAGTTGKTVGQSGISKRLDAVDGNELLPKLARSLSHGEETLAEFALLILRDATPTPDEIETIKVCYPTTFDLFSLEDLVEATLNFQAIMAAAGEAPEAEIALLTALIRKVLPGLDEEAYESIDQEIEDRVNQKSIQKQQAAESMSVQMLAGPAAAESFDAFADNANDLSGGERQPGIEGNSAAGLGRAIN